MANLFGEIHGFPKGMATENSWNTPRVGIFYEFSMDSPTAWSWKTHGLFHGQSIGGNPWIPQWIVMENVWNIP